MLSIKRGTTPTLLYTMNIPVNTLTEFRCVITQGDFVGYLETEVGLKNEVLLCTLKEDDSQLLVGGSTAWLQVLGIDADGNAICFPMEEVYIEDADDEHEKDVDDDSER